MTYLLPLILVAVFAWCMVVWNVGEGRAWSRPQRLLVVYVGVWVLLVLYLYLTP